MNPDDLPAVLYCDHDGTVLKAFSLSFGSRFRIFRCSSVDEALALLEARGGEFGVVITELTMPGSSGVELLMRARTLAPDARRMIVTGSADMQAVLDAFTRGQATRYFIKPWQEAEVSGALEDALKSVFQERKGREMESRTMRAEHLATLGQATASIAHELVVPLGYLSQKVSALRRDISQVIEYANKHLARDKDRVVAETVADLPSLIDDLATGTEHLRQVTQGLKAQVRGEDTELAAELSEAVSSAVKLARAEVRERARLTNSGQPVRVLFSPVKLCQVLLNLIVNAAQSMAGIGRQGRIDLRWTVQGDNVVLTVSDNGCGIPVEQQEKVFQPNFTATQEGNVPGLGLFICKELVTQNGGKLKLTSVPGEGTDIEITLARAPMPRGGPNDAAKS